MGLKSGNLGARLRIGLKSALLGVGFPTLSLRRVDQSLILFYHAICDEDVPIPAFERQIRYLQRHFELVFASEIDQPSPSGRLRWRTPFARLLKTISEPRKRVEIRIAAFGLKKKKKDP